MKFHSSKMTTSRKSCSRRSWSVIRSGHVRRQPWWPSMTFMTKLATASAGCSASSSANTWHALSVGPPASVRATNPNNLCTPQYRTSSVQGGSGAGTRGHGVPHFFRQGDASPSPPLFGLKFVQKLVHCCNSLLTEKQSTAELTSICYRHSNTSSCIAGQDQRSAVAISPTCMSVRVCRPKLF